MRRIHSSKHLLSSEALQRYAESQMVSGGEETNESLFDLLFHTRPIFTYK